MRQPSSHLLVGYLGSGILLFAALLAGCAAPSTNSVQLTGSNSAGSSPGAVRTPTSRAGASSTPAGSSSNTPQLSCVLQTTVHPIDTVSETLRCTVAQVASSETAFVLRFTATSNAGPYTFFPFPECKGTLSDGSGSCSMSISGTVPFRLARGTVAGATIPHQYRLGPVVPTQVATTPTGSPPPFVPFGTPIPAA
jgi:hypothetical protein